ncbi:Fur family transcriptional regulator [Reyranella sp.]|uniref:Fur family transcriptional regulator n=1 Tax=Reyranella sp. TaxID=1929291 RepID=UPI0040360F68
MVQSPPSAPPETAPTETAPQVDRAVQAAQQACDQKGLRLTALRAAVLRIIARSNRPLGAYALLVLLQDEVGRKHTPPTIYRALEFLLEIGSILRVESRNAYILRDHPERPGSPVLFLCDTCDSSVAVESPVLAELIESNAATLKFHIARPVIECSGTCDRCAEAAADTVIRGASDER